MKICVLTTELTEKHGWGRYSIDLIGALENRGVEIVFVENILPDPLDYLKNYFLAPWYAWKLRALAKDCDVVHAFIEPYSYIAYWFAKLIGKKYFITAHGTFGVLPYSFPAYKKYFHKKSFTSAEKIICVSNYTKKRLAEFGLHNLTVINNGIDYSKFYNPNGRYAEKKVNFILSVGALKHRKGQHISIKAFASVRKNFKNLHYYIVVDQSDAAYFDQLKRLVSDLSLKENVIFLNSVSDKELVGLYEKARLFILTPVSEGNNFEGFGLVYLEANACGLPVIGSFGSGVEDAIKEGETGLLVPQNNPEALARTITKILDDEDLYKKLVSNGSEWAKDHDWNKVVESYVKTYTLS